MDTTTIFIVSFVVSLLIAVPGAIRSFRSERRRVIARGATKLKTRMDALYSGAHEYQRVDLDDFPRLDRSFYEATESELRKRGFSHVGDVENLTLSRAMPGTRTCMRVLTGDNGRIRVAIYHLRPRGFLRCLQLLGLLPRNLKVVDFVSEMGLGRFTATSATLGLDRMTYPEEIDVERHPQQTPPLELLQRHRERISTIGPDGAPAVPAHTWDDVIASMQRGDIVLSRHRQSLGSLTAEELERMVQRPLRRTEEELLDELRKQGERDKIGT